MTSVTFIVPCYNEAENITRFYEEFHNCFSRKPLHFDWRLLFIDDGSTDGTWNELVELAEKRSRVFAIRFSRNFGKEAAIWAGLNNASSDFIGIIDADLQQPPEDAYKMCVLLNEDSGIDCVAAYQEHRYEREGVLARVKTSFYQLFSKITSMDAIENASDFRVFRRKVADAILSMPESFRFSKGIFAWVGFEVYPYPYSPADRAFGESKWSLVALVRYAIEGMLAFSTKPLRLATGLGLLSAACAVIYFFVVFIRALVVGIEVPGYATLMSVILLLGGSQLLCIGIMGEYLARAYIQGKQRPIYLERDRTVSNSSNSERSIHGS